MTPKDLCVYSPEFENKSGNRKENWAVKEVDQEEEEEEW